MKNSVKLVLNKLPALKVTFAKLASQDVLVGVPRDETIRKDPEESSPMNNATLAYIHENGAPASNIPARPFMEPGISNAKSRLVRQFGIAAKQAVQGNDAAIDKGLHTTGLIAQASIRNAINEGPPPPLAASTIAARKRRGRTGTKPLIDTGQLRNSINYVVRRKHNGAA